MKKQILPILFSILFFFLTACTEKKDFRGTWNAVDINQQKYILVMTDNKFSFEREDGGLLSKKLTRIDENIRHKILYYNILLDDDRFIIYFPDKKNLNTAMILEPKTGALPYEGFMHFKLQRQK